MPPSSELRRNHVTGTTVAIALGREKSLEQLRRTDERVWKAKPELVKGDTCPFCVGHEQMTPPEVRAYRDPVTLPNTPGWWVRSVTNPFPAVDESVPSTLLEERQVGPIFSVTDGFGYHYVVIETTEHISHMALLEQRKFQEVVSMWRDMILWCGSDRNIKYSFLFENYGPLAGASQPHCHSQIIALPMAPTRVRNELRGMAAYYETNRCCPTCQEIEWERRMEVRVVDQSENFIAWCPFTSKTPYQVMISPIDHQSYFANISTHTGVDRLAEYAILHQQVLKRIRIALNDPDYNLYFHTAPANQTELPYYHWHCQIEPVTTAIQAGFEKGSGMCINPCSPESAARDLRAVIING